MIHNFNLLINSVQKWRMNEWLLKKSQICEKKIYELYTSHTWP